MADESLEEMQKRFKEMEEEAKKLKQLQQQVTSQLGLFDLLETTENKEEVDARSIYIGNVDYSTTPEELQQHFQSCGTINRVTILCDKQGHPKGFLMLIRFAYIEFKEQESVQHSMALNESLFKGRVLVVSAKRTNVPAFQRGRGRGRGFRARGRRSRGRGRGGYQPY